MQWNFNVGGGITCNASAAAFVTTTNAPTYKNLEGSFKQPGAQSGGSLTVTPVTVGLDYVMSPNYDTGEMYTGWTASAGLGGGLAFEEHCEVTTSGTIAVFNLYNSTEIICDKIIEWSN